LETRGKSRVSVKPSLFGDVTSEEFHAALVTKYAKQKKAEEQAAAKNAKARWEAPVIAKIIEVDHIDDKSEATVKKLPEILESLDLSPYGNRKTLIERLAVYYEIGLDQEEDCRYVEPDLADADEDENGGNVSENQDIEAAEAEEDRSPEDDIQVVDYDLQEMADEVAAKFQRDEGAIQTLLDQRSEQMKNHCDQQLLAAKQAFREWQAKAVVKGK